MQWIQTSSDSVEVLLPLLLRAFFPELIEKLIFIPYLNSINSATVCSMSCVEMAL